MLKVPQIMTMITKKTAVGLSFPSMLSEILLLVISIGYNLHYGYALTTYAESAIILVQNFVILYLAFKFHQVSFVQFAIGFLAGLSLLAAYVLDLVPEQIYLSNQLIICGLVLGARLPQILANYRNKSTGVLSLVSNLMSTAGVYARVFTTLVEVPDKLVLFNALLGAVLNTTVLLQIIFYSKNTAKIVEKEKANKAK